MAAGRIKGITIEIGGDTTKLVSALSKVDNAISASKTNIRDLDRALKLDPTNVNLIKDRQRELGNEIKATEEKVKAEKEALEQLKNTEGFDANSEAARNLQTQIDLDESALKQLKKEAKDTASVMKTQFQAVGQKFEEIGNKVKNVGDSISSFGSKLTATVTVPIVAAGAKAVTSFAEVDKTMTLANKTMNNSAEEAKMLNTAMEEAASNSTFGMNDAANAALNFARAGLDATEAANAMAPALNLAAGESGDLDTVSAGLVATINGFGDGFGEAEHYADVFAAACNNSALDVNSLSESMSVAAPIFKTAGKDVEDAALMLGVMANAGIEAEVAANSLKTGMARLAEPTKQAREAMEKYGIAMSDIWNEDGSMKDMTVIQENLNRSFSQLSEQEQMAAAGAIFGKNQMAAWLAVINTAPESVQELNTSLQNVDGTTREMSDAMMSGFGGSIEKLKSSIDVLMTSLGGLLAQYLTPVIEKIQELVDKFMGLDEGTKEMIIKIALIAAAVGPLIVVIGTIISSIGSIVAAIGTVLEVGGALLAFLATPAGLIALIIAAIGLLVVAIYQNWDAIKAWVQGVVIAIQEMATGVIFKIQEIKAKAIALWEEIKTTVISKVTELKNNVVNTWNDLKTTVITTITNLKAQIEQLWTNIKTWLSTTVDNIKTKVTTVFDALKTTVTNTLNNLKTQINTIWTNIKTWLSQTVDNIKSKVTTAFDNIKNNIVDRISTAKNSIINGMSEAADYISSLPDRFLEWGRDMIQNLIDGIKEKISGVIDAVSDVADAIASYLHFSVPDKGPLADADTYMPDFIDLMTSGIAKGLPKLESAATTMANALATPELNSAGSSVANTVNITVYGAEGQDVSDLADIIQDRINMNVYRNGAAFA